MRTIAFLLALLSAGCATICPTGWKVGAEVARGYPGVYDPGMSVELSGDIGHEHCAPLDSE